MYKKIQFLGGTPVCTGIQLVQLKTEFVKTYSNWLQSDVHTQHPSQVCVRVIQGITLCIMLALTLP